MRKLVYVGKNNFGEVVETTIYTEKKEYERKGFRFTERLDEVRQEETEEQREKRLARIEKRKKARKEKV